MMIDIGMHDAAGPVRIKDVAKRQGISVKYLEQIVAILTKAGYVNSVRGPQGGYRLAMAPKDYTAGMILRLTEGDFAPVACCNDDYECPQKQDCVTIRLWRELDIAINQVLDKYTLEDLIGWQTQAFDDYVI